MFDEDHLPQYKKITFKEIKLKKKFEKEMILI
jgi:hypothetical protein